MINDRKQRKLTSAFLQGQKIETAFVGAGSILIVKFLNTIDAAGASHLSCLVNCAWRVGHGARLLTTWRDMSGDNRDICIDVVGQLVGEKIVSARFAPGLADLTIKLTSGKCIEIFVDIADFRESEDNYYIKSHKGLIACKSDGFLRLEVDVSD